MSEPGGSATALLTPGMRVVRYDGRSVDLVLAEGEDHDHVIAAN